MADQQRGDFFLGRRQNERAQGTFANKPPEAGAVLKGVQESP